MSSVSSLNSLLSSSSSSSSPGVDLSSLLSAATGSTSAGIDVNSAVAAAVYAAQAPERQWQAQQSSITAQITALTSLQTSMSTVSGDLNDLNSLTGSLAARTVSSSSSAVSGTATSSAATGSHLVEVDSLATTASWYSPAVASSTSTLGAMNLQIVGQGGATTTITTGGGVNTLAQLATAINQSGTGVTASVVNDANGARLAIVGSASGSANDFAVNYGTVSGGSWASSTVASASTALGASSFVVGDGSQTTTFQVNAGQNLNDVANSINAAGLDVTASVVTDGSGAHLSLSSTTGTVTVAGDPTFAMNRASTGSNASLKVDGIPVSSATNQVSGVVNGLTLNLQGVTNGQTTVTVAADTTTISTAVQKFVTDYNALLSSVSSQFTYSASSGSQGVLSGDTNIRSLQAALLGAISYQGSSGGATSLASLGVTMGDDGSLTLNTSTLNASLSSNPSSVQNFFQGTALNGFAQSFQTQLKTFADPATGAVALEISNLNQTYTSLQSQVTDYESGYIASQRTILTAMYSKAEIALQSLPTTLKQVQSELGENSSS